MTIRMRALGEEEAADLAHMARSRTLGAGLVRRAQIIQHAADGLNAPGIAAKMGLCGATVRFWLKRFNERGLPGLPGRACKPACVAQEDVDGCGVARLPSRKPWPSSQPRLRSSASWSARSIPSATTSRPRFSPSWMIARASAAASASPPMSSTKASASSACRAETAAGSGATSSRCRSRRLRVARRAS